MAVARGCEAAVVLTLDATPSDGQRDLVEALVRAGIPTVAIAVRNPYDIAAYPDVDAFLATYSDLPVAMRALADLLTGAAGCR